MKHLIRLMFLLICLSVINSSYAEIWRKEIPDAKMIGSGEFSWWGLSIYTAKLWQRSGNFQANDIFALEITYHKSISRERFVNTSIEEIKRLHGDQYSSAQLQQWRGHMEKAFTDVRTGEQLIGVYLPKIGCRFYNQRALLAEINDESFAQAFFSIWLDPRSKDLNLRKQLLGQTP